MVQTNGTAMPKERRSISFNSELLAWMDKYIEAHYEYKDRSHFIDVLIRRFREREMTGE